MILVNGCSFSTNTQLDRKVSHLTWPNVLSDKLNTQVENFAFPGKSNRLIFRQLYTYLIWAKQGKAKLPKYVVMQTTDNFRDHIFSNAKTNLFKPNNFVSQIEMRYWLKMVSWNGYLANKQTKKYKGVGSTLRYLATRRKNRAFIIEEDEVPIMDESLREPELRHALEIISLQRLCKELEIKFCILPFFGFYSHNIHLDPLYKEIHQGDFCTTDMQNGLFYYLSGNGFNRTDGYHFNIDGHKFIADTVYDFLTNDKKLKVSNTDNLYAQETIAMPANKRASLPEDFSFDYT